MANFWAIADLLQELHPPDEAHHHHLHNALANYYKENILPQLDPALAEKLKANPEPLRTASQALVVSSSGGTYISECRGSVGSHPEARKNHQERTCIRPRERAAPS